MILFLLCFSMYILTTDGMKDTKRIHRADFKEKIKLKTEKEKNNAVQTINKRFEHLNNNEKNGIYTSIWYEPSKNIFKCKYWSKEEKRQRFVCESNDFGVCVFNAQKKVKENPDTIPSYVASLIKEDNDKINEINKKFKLLSDEEKGEIYNGITYLPAKKEFRCSYRHKEKKMQVHVYTSIDFGKCVFNAQKKVKENLEIPRYVATNKNMDEINIMNDIKKINGKFKNLSDKEKAANYNCINYVAATRSRFYCEFWNKQEKKRVRVCTYKNFGECVYNPQQIVKNNPNIPDHVAQFKNFLEIPINFQLKIIIRKHL